MYPYTSMWTSHLIIVCPAGKDYPISFEHAGQWVNSSMLSMCFLLNFTTGNSKCHTQRHCDMCLLFTFWCWTHSIGCGFISAVLVRNSYDGLAIILYICMICGFTHINLLNAVYGGILFIAEPVFHGAYIPSHTQTQIIHIKSFLWMVVWLYVCTRARKHISFNRMWTMSILGIWYQLAKNLYKCRQKTEKLGSNTFCILRGQELDKLEER